MQIVAQIIALWMFVNSNINIRHNRITRIQVGVGRPQTLSLAVCSEANRT